MLRRCRHLVSIRNMSTLHHSLFPSVPITLPENLSEQQLLSFPAFDSWLKNLQHNLSLQTQPTHPFHSSPFALQSISITSVTFFSSQKPGFLTLSASLQNNDGTSLPGSALLRGPSVAILVLITPDDNQDEVYTLLTVQPRVPAASLGLAELPAGMLDDSGNFAGKAASELKEETGLEIGEGELVDLWAEAVGQRGKEGEEKLAEGMFPSAGGCDEVVRLLACRKRMARGEVEGLKGKLGGLREHGEMITLKVVRLEDLWREGARDAKALSALALYEGLKREGRLEGLFAAADKGHDGKGGKDEGKL